MRLRKLTPNLRKDLLDANKSDEQIMKEYNIPSKRIVKLLYKKAFIIEVNKSRLGRKSLLDKGW